MPDSARASGRSRSDTRRNHYRTLHVQPDAPFEVIRASYRTLMRTLKLHPDLGGDHAEAVHLNTAYAVLGHPAGRAAYDRALLKRYDIQTLCGGPPSPATQRPGEDRWTSSRRRTLYGTLVVQPDAPVEVIEASHRVLSSRVGGTSAALEEALATLRDPARRDAYDQVLGLRRRARAKGPSAPGVGISRGGPGTHPSGLRHRGYEPTITQYCVFCKTPHSGDRAALEASGCVECSSPLFAPPTDVAGDLRRALDRAPGEDDIEFYTCWPGQPRSGRLIDLSLAGLRFRTFETCRDGDIIKIDAARFQAVGVIAHQHRDGHCTTAGVTFHAVAFRHRRGTFVSRSA